MNKEYSYCCEYCGELFVAPRVIDYVVSEEIFPDGRKIAETEPRSVSPCCEDEYEAILISPEIVEVRKTP